MLPNLRANHACPSVCFCICFSYVIFFVRLDYGAGPDVWPEDRPSPSSTSCFVSGGWGKVRWLVTCSQPFSLFHSMPSFWLQTDYTVVSGHAGKPLCLSLYVCAWCFNNGFVALWAFRFVMWQDGDGAEAHHVLCLHLFVCVCVFACACVCILWGDTAVLVPKNNIFPSSLPFLSAVFIFIPLHSHEILKLHSPLSSFLLVFWVVSVLNPCLSFFGR